MKTTKKYNHPDKKERLKSALYDTKEYLGEAKYKILVRGIKAEYEYYGIRHAIRMNRVYCMIAGIEGLPVRAILTEATKGE